MLARDKDRPENSPSRRGTRRPARLTILALRAALLAFALTGLVGCNRMIAPRGSQQVKDADTSAAEGDFLHAVNLYESALEDSASAADTHYRLALLYAVKMNDPLNALHHFKRYLILAPSGIHASEVKNFMKRDELALVTTLSGDSVVTRAEGARLKNENLALRKEVEDRTEARLAAANEKKAEKTLPTAKAGKSGPRTHTVETGDTLSSLSRKYYGSASHVKELRRANKKSLDASGKLKVGQTLTIP